MHQDEHDDEGWQVVDRDDAATARGCAPGIVRQRDCLCLRCHQPTLPDKRGSEASAMPSRDLALPRVFGPASAVARLRAVTLRRLNRAPNEDLRGRAGSTTPCT